MHKMDFEKMDYLEKIGGGLLGAIAIIASILELVLGEINPASIAGAVKDIAGTLIVVMVLLAALKQLVPKKKQNFEECFEYEMEKIMSKYTPLISKDESLKGRYNIADRMDVLYNNSEDKGHKLFDFDYVATLQFKVSKTLFMGRSKEDFSLMQKSIVESIASKITREYEEYLRPWKPSQDGFTLNFKEPLKGNEDARVVAEIIDKIILLYIVECKK